MILMAAPKKPVESGGTNPDYGVGKSEMARSLDNLARQYKKFCFDTISRLPYPRVKQWIAFSDLRMEDAFREERSVRGSITDYYTVSLLSLVVSIVAFWPLFAYLGFIGTLFGSLALAGTMHAGGIAVLLPVLALIAAISLIAPAISITVYSAGMYAAARLLGGNGSFRRTMNAVVMGSASKIILMIPLYALYAILIGYVLQPVALVIGIYVLYLLYRALRHVHGLSMKRGIAALVLGVLLTAIIMGALVGAAAVSIIFLVKSGVF